MEFLKHFRFLIFDFRFPSLWKRLGSFFSKSLQSKIANLKSKILASCVLLLTLCLFTEIPAYAGDSSIRGAFSFSGFATGIGTRAMGMNGAFAAVSDDSSSAYWNPAGLTSSWYKELSFTRADLYDLDLITSNTLNISAPETRGGAMSFGWTRLQYDFESWREEAFLMSYAKTLVGERMANTGQAQGPAPIFSLSCGVTLKYLRQTSKLELTPTLVAEESEVSTEAAAQAFEKGLSERFCKARGMGWDVGLLARINAKDGRNRFSIAITAQDIPTVIKWNSGSDEETKEYIPYRYKAGCSFEPIPRLTVALDLVGEQNVSFKEIHLGMEHWIFSKKNNFPISEKNLAIRGGIAKQLSGSKRMTFAGGIGIRWSAWQLDYAYLMDNDGLGDTRNRFSVSVRF